ncbi:MAG: outer membrane lipoprotein carrier protein LolA [Ignavibacteria bacterium]|nr:outer membrane lipoprotein carrier protein LolA [Ignavibacteria bacterium]
MKKISGLICILMAFAAFFGSTSAQTVKKMQDKYNSLPGFEVQFEQANAGISTLKGKLFYKKPNKMRAELKNLIMITDGKSTWNYQKSSKKVIISTYEENDASLLNFSKIVFEYPKKCAVKESLDNGVTVLDFTANDKKMQYAHIKCWVKPDLSISKIELTDRANHTSSFVFSGWNFSAPSDSQFTFEPGKGVQVIDLR